jgi:hypothetical protein
MEEAELSDGEDLTKPENPIASLGGKASAAKLTPEERTERARKAAEARWNAGVVQATHEGSFPLGNTELFAAVLPDGKRLLTQATFLRAIGRARSPKAGTGVLTTVDELPFFLQAKALKPFITPDLVTSTTPVFFVDKGGKKSVGYDAELLPAVAEVYLRLRDHYAKQKQEPPQKYQHIIDACDLLMRGLARVGIVALVDEATGYQFVRPNDELRKILEQYISKELAKWVLTFQPDFYREMYRLRKWELNPDSHKKPGVVAKYTLDLVYDRIHPDLVRELKQTRVDWEDAGGRKGGKLFQFLTTDSGHPRLKQHIEGVIQIMRFSKDWHQFMYRMGVSYPKINETPNIPFPDDD